MTARHVYIVEDEEPIRRSSSLMLRLMGLTPRAFESGADFLRSVDELAPGCVLLDIRMPEIDGLEVQRRLSAANLQHSVVVMSGHADLAVAVPAFESGAVAFIEKPFSRATLRPALDLAFTRLEEPQAYLESLGTAERAVQSLDPADREVLALLARGVVNDEIAGRLSVTPTAVELSRSRIFEHLEVSSMTEALRFAFAAALRRAALG